MDKNSKTFLDYKKAYELANNKPLFVTFDTSGEFFYIEGMPYKISKMAQMTETLNLRNERTGKT